MNKKEFVEKVLRFSREKGLWKKGDSVLAAVSGGPDSLGLLLFLQEIREREGIRIGCCCVNHHLREAAEKETEYVEELCRRFRIPFYRRDVDVPAARQKEKGSVETVARTLRYEALADAAEEGGFSHIALAHHKDDQAETILFHFLRGSGMKGLTGIQPVRGCFIRPFLSVTRKEIGEFLSAFPVTPCHDETNDIPNATRNRIRLLLMPQLLSYNPELVESLSRMADILRGEEDFLEEEEKKEEPFFYGTDDVLTFPRKHWLSLHPALQRRILRRAGEKVSGRAPDAEGVERMRLLALQGRKGKMTSAAGTVMEVGREVLLFRRGNSHTESRGSTKEELYLLYKKWMEKEKPVSEETGIISSDHRVTETLGPWTMTIEKLNAPVKTMKCQYLLDGDQVGHIRLKRAEKNDRMEPLGMEGSRKIFSILQENGISPELRREWPLAADEEHIYWTGFLRGSRRARVTEGTTNFLLLTLTWNDKETESET